MPDMCLAIIPMGELFMVASVYVASLDAYTTRPKSPTPVTPTTGNTICPLTITCALIAPANPDLLSACRFAKPKNGSPATSGLARPPVIAPTAAPS